MYLIQIYSEFRNELYVFNGEKLNEWGREEGEENNNNVNININGV